ncbi:unnamed protein product, partial [Adineta ricciae]
WKIIESRVKWTQKWFNMDGVSLIVNLFKNPILKSLKNNRNVCMSHKGLDTMYYTDMNGKKHPDPYVGVTTIYCLNEDGTRIFFADPWLQNKFHNELTTPEDGQFIAESMATSGSTLFLLQRAKNEFGQEINKMYTRFADFDSIGSNPALTSTYNRTNYVPLVRFLPPEDWIQQPAINLQGNARLTKNISVFQIGWGQNNRQLRVQGTDSDGNVGFYSKNIYENQWKFQLTNNIEISEEEFLSESIPYIGFAKGPQICFDYTNGEFRSNLKEIHFENIILEKFSHRGLNERGLHTKLILVLSSTLPMSIPLYARRGWKSLLGLSKSNIWKLVIPFEYFQSDDREIQLVLEKIFANRFRHNVHVYESKQQIDEEKKKMLQSYRNQGINTVVCLLTGHDQEILLHGQKSLIDASKKVSVKRFTTSDYETDLLNIKIDLKQEIIKSFVPRNKKFPRHIPMMLQASFIARFTEIHQVAQKVTGQLMSNHFKTGVFINESLTKTTILRPTWIDIDLDLVRVNVQTLKKYVGDPVHLIAIVNANAYGYGIMFLEIIPNRTEKLIHCSNSGATLFQPEKPFYNMVRCGNALTSPPNELLNDFLLIKLQSVISLRSVLSFVKKVEAGEKIDYGDAYTTTKKQWISTIPMGFGDGWHQNLKPTGVFVEGQRMEIGGRIPMVQMMIALDLEYPVGTRVTFIGQQGNVTISGDEITGIAKMPRSGIFSVILNRVPLVYRESSTITSFGHRNFLQC